MIILNDKFRSDKNNGENSRTSSTVTSSPYKAYSYQYFDHGNYEHTNIQDNGNVVPNSADTKQDSYLPHFEQHISYSDDSNRFSELESVSSKSKQKKGNPHSIKRLPLLLQIAMSSDNSIIHYHEHEHVHRHNKLPSKSQKLQGRLKQSDSGSSSTYPDQNFESTKSHYHQRDHPNKTSTRNRNKPYEPNLHHHSEQYNPHEEDEYRNGFGQKKHPKFKRGDLHFNRHRSHGKSIIENEIEID